MVLDRRDRDHGVLYPHSFGLVEDNLSFPAFDSGPFGAFPDSQDHFGDGSVILLPTPGHSPGHMCVLLRMDGGSVLFVGDTLYTLPHLAVDQVRRMTIGGADTARQIEAARRVQALLAAEPATVPLFAHDNTRYHADRVVPAFAGGRPGKEGCGVAYAHGGRSHPWLAAAGRARAPLCPAGVRHGAGTGGVPMTPARRTRGRPRDPEADEAIMKAALELFVERGPEGANVEQIAKRAGVAKVTVYRRWSSKEELLVQAIEQARTLVPGAEVWEAADAAARPVDERLAGSWAGTLSDERFRAVLALLIGSSVTQPSLLATYREQYIEPRRRLIRAALERAHPRPAPTSTP
ncbi:TetR family transcriptional regulator [Nonomuraea thailandensis]